MERICKNCKYWGVYFESSCDKVDCITEKDKGFEIDAWASDDSGLNAILKTGPMFGCVYFTDKNVS